MNAAECLNILREIKDCAFATVDENGLPQNRIIDVMLVEDEKLYFLTARGKHFYNQLENGKVAAITGLNDKWQTVRLVGKVEKLAEQKYWIDRFFELNPSMNGVYPGDARYILEPFCIKDGELEFFDLSDSPIYRESFTLGNGTVTEKGFVITDNCIGCGLCETNCPQKCIEIGTPFEIHQNNCLHCGLCFENCPVQAIVKREEM
jgi:uncharacterized pyridoxamine 5'-phosphate oxidase family protein